MSSRSRRAAARIALAVALAALSAPALALQSGASDPRVVVPGASVVPTTDTVVDHPITTEVDFALASPHQAELTRLIAETADPASPEYRHFLTPAEYAARFGATPSAVRALRTFLAGYGLTVTGLSAGHNLLHVSGTTTEFARALDARVETIHVAGGGDVGHLVTAATLPESLSKDVAAIDGLSQTSVETTNFERASATSRASEPAASTTTEPSSCPSAGVDSGNTPIANGGYTALQQAELYGFDTMWAKGDNGSGETIALYELAQYDAADVSAYFSCYGLSPSITQISVDGGADHADGPSSESAIEANLDVEEAGVLAPGAHLEVYTGPNESSTGPLDIYSQIASDDTADVVSTSWGECEPDPTGDAEAEAVVFQQMALEGQTIVAAAGDSGSTDCWDDPDVSESVQSELAVDDPASQPYVTGVGGLTVNSISPLSETVWNDNCRQALCGAGGGGESALWPKPDWQVGDGITSADTMRMVPDLSVMGDPDTGFIVYYTGSPTGVCNAACENANDGWTGIGGTSIGSPLVSALVATAAQACGQAQVGLVNPLLYDMAATGFNDVTTGSNDLLGVGSYSAGVGYDEASGLGSPNGSAAFFAGLCPPVPSPSASSFAVSATSVVAGTSSPTVTVTLRSTTGQPVADEPVTVTATGSSGEVLIDNAQASVDKSDVTTSSYSVTTDSSGAASFTIYSLTAQTVKVSVAAYGSTLYTTTIDFTMAPTVPGAPSIKSLTALVGGFRLVLKPPSSDGGSKITSYQYSTTKGRTWVAIPHGSTSVTVTHLKKGAAYVVVARAVNAEGPSLVSGSKRIVTKT